MEREGGCLEQKGHEDEKGPADDRRRLEEGMGAQILADQRKLGAAGGAINEGAAHDQETPGKGAEHEVLEERFRADHILAVITDENVDGQGHDLQGDEHSNQLLGHGQEQHARRGEHGQAVVLGGAEGILFEVRLRTQGGEQPAGQDDEAGSLGEVADHQNPIENIPVQGGAAGDARSQLHEKGDTEHPGTPVGCDLVGELIIGGGDHQQDGPGADDNQWQK